MSVIPSDVETHRQPPMAIPLAHFLVSLLALATAAGIGLANTIGITPGLRGVAHLHLLLVGWICLTIMGAMTQFVPVWSGVALHSKRLAAAQLYLVSTGLAGLVSVFLAGRIGFAGVGGVVLLAGVWVFVYNIARTLPTDSLDVTERHFAAALFFFLLTTVLGLLLAGSYTLPILAAIPITRTDVIDAHATMAVFGAVLTTVLGALYQLGTMFTQTELNSVERRLQRCETVGYPLGVLALTAGRLLDIFILARVGSLLVVAGLVTIALIVAHKLIATRVEWTPMLSRYAVAVMAILAWALLTVRAWIVDPITPAARFGAPGSLFLLVLGVVGFVVAGTLYHIIPFIIWVHRYSDLLGYEPVPMVDDLYNDQLAQIDLACLFAGTLVLSVGGFVDVPDVGEIGGALLVLFGAVGFIANLLGVVREHSQYSLIQTLHPRALVARESEPTQ